MTAFDARDELLARVRVAEVDTPSLLVDSERVDANIARMQAHMDQRGIALRPHAKTHKSIELARRQVEAGAVGITVATLGEAEVFAAAGITDIFMAYPLWAEGPKGERLAGLAKQCRLSVGVDNVAAVAHLAAAVPELAVLIEVDSGGARTGCTTPELVAEVAKAARASGLDVRGAFTHGGHAYAGRAESSYAADDEVQALTWARDAVASVGVEAPVLSAGATPSVRLSAREPVTEERPGTYVFQDRQQLALGATPDEIALMVVTRVVSEAPGRAVVDAGAKTLAKDAPGGLDGYAWLPDYPEAVVTRTHDHHAVIESGGGLPRVGELVVLVPNHVCPVVNLARSLVFVGSDGLAGVYPVDAGLASS